LVISGILWSFYEQDHPTLPLPNTNSLTPQF
jgi:hypothetical protein